MSSEARLEDLFKRGRPVTITDPKTEKTAVVYVAKLSRPQRIEATKRADAVRARIISLRNHTDSDDYMAIKNGVYEMDDRDQLVALIIGEDVAKLRIVTQAEIEHDEKWSEDNYLSGLQRDWSETMAERFGEDSEDSEARRVYEELNRFLDEVQDAVSQQIDSLRGEYTDKTIEELQELAMPAMLDEAANTAWSEEYERCGVWQATYKAVRRGEDEDGNPIYGQGDRYFKHRHQVDEIDDEVYLPLHHALREITVGGYEGKDSPESPDSSTSSEPSGEVVMAASSGQTDAPA